ncbi:MAG: hypothetical protein ACQESE_02475 [Nanobdellota archaeon]
MVELYTINDMNELMELLDVVKNKTDSIGQTVLVNTYFSKDRNESRNAKGKIPALVPINATSTDNSREYKGANSIDLFTMADPVFYEGGVIDSGFEEKNPSSPLIGLEGKALYEESLKQGYNPKETMGNHPFDWECAGKYKSDMFWDMKSTSTGDHASSKSGIYNLIQEHLNVVNDKYHTVMEGSNVPQDIKSSYQRMTDF